MSEDFCASRDFGSAHDHTLDKVRVGRVSCKQVVELINEDYSAVVKQLIHAKTRGNFNPFDI